MLDVDDKDLVIITVTPIALTAMFTISEPNTLLTSIVSGLFGVAVGRNTNNGG